jgi:predicted pyridoxine 5'-phosphate oxidase superfamily flavin-nucleotide-binding protein
MKEVLAHHVCYVATSANDGKPNVVPIGLAEVVDDTHVMIVDVFMNKTRKNIEENQQVAFAVTDSAKLQAWQFKGNASVVTSGELFDKAVQRARKALENMRTNMQKRLENTDDTASRTTVKKIVDNLRVLPEAKAAILVDVREAYSTIMAAE